MGILSIMNRNLLSKFKSTLKPVSSSNSSDPWHIRRFFVSAATAHPWLRNAAHAPTLTGDSQPNSKLVFLIQRVEEKFPKYSFLYSAAASACNSWTDHPIPNPFSGPTTATTSQQLLYGSCQELTYFFDNDLNYKGESRQRRVSLWNPTTNHIHTLPLSHLPRPNPVSYIDINCSGFGFEPNSHDYKFLSFLCYYYDGGLDSADEYHIELYSRKRNEWKRIDASLHDGILPLHEPAVHVNGVYHWTVLGGCKEARGELSILSFDFADEEFSLMRLPEAAELLPIDVVSFLLVEFYGSLGTLVYTDTDTVEQADDEPFSFEIFVWDGKSWKCVLPRVTIGYDFLGGDKVHRVLGLFENVFLLLQSLKGELMLFDIKARKLENLGIHGSLEYRSLSVFPFLSS